MKTQSLNLPEDLGYTARHVWARKDGDTLVIGGLISNSEIKSLNKVPLLGDLPILGKLFQSVSKSKNETEVVIFLKAKVVK